MAFAESFSAVQSHVLLETLWDLICEILREKICLPSGLVMALKRTVALFRKMGHIRLRMKIKHGNLHCI